MKIYPVLIAILVLIALVIILPMVAEYVTEIRSAIP